MKEKRLIDANNLADLEALERINRGGYQFYRALDVWDCIDAAPTVDAVEVVRCKDCKYAMNEEGVKHTNGFCRCEYFFLSLEEDHFCSYGERNVDG